MIVQPRTEKRGDSRSSEPVLPSWQQSQAVREQRRTRDVVGGQATSAADAALARSASDQDFSHCRLPIRQLAVFTRQMAMLLNAGSGIVPALQSIARQLAKPTHCRLIHRVCLDIEEGEPLASALRKYPAAFDPTYCAIVAAGEATATLPEMFERLARIVGKRRVIRNRILGAMAYPALLSLLSVSILSVLLFFVLPRFGDMFKTLGVELPASTSTLLSIGAWAKAFWYVEVPLFLLLIGGLVFALQTPRGRQWMSDVSIRIPLLGRLISGLIQGETFRVLGMLIEARVGVLEAIELVSGVTRNSRFQKLYDNMAEEVTSGGSVSTALESSPLISSAIAQAIKTGEESGQLGPAATYVANILDEDNTEMIDTITKLVEPLILIVMGFVVGSVAVSLFMPLFDMTSAI
jgi:type II secretory pathway component PulF